MRFEITRMSGNALQAWTRVGGLSGSDYVFPPTVDRRGTDHSDADRRLLLLHAFGPAYRWFCRLGLEDAVPHHSSFSKNRHGRFRDNETLWLVFEKSPAAMSS